MENNEAADHKEKIDIHRARGEGATGQLPAEVLRHGKHAFYVFNGYEQHGNGAQLLHARQLWPPQGLK